MGKGESSHLVGTLVTMDRRKSQTQVGEVRLKRKEASIGKARMEALIAFGQPEAAPVNQSC